MKLVVLDRDGVINRDSENFIRSVDEWLPVPGSLAAIARLTRAGFTIAVATNQSGLARGLFDRAALDRIHGRMLDAVEAAGGAIAHIAVCPHSPEDGCACRKPKPGLLDEIVRKLAVPEHGVRWMIGDRPSDVHAGAARGFRPILVRTGKGRAAAADPGIRLPTGCVIAEDLADAAALLLSESVPGARDGRQRTLSRH